MVFHRSYFLSFFISLVLLLVINTAHGQSRRAVRAKAGPQTRAYLGLRVTGNMGWSVFEDENYRSFTTSLPKTGYSVGLMFLAENKNKYGFQVELNYSKKGRSVDGDGNDFTKNRASYTYLDMPILVRFAFNGPGYKWYLSGGPELSYWLGGKGTYTKFYPNNPDDLQFVDHGYKIAFEPYPEDRTQENPGKMYVGEANRFQLGFNFAIGFIIQANDVNFIGLEGRYSIGHTYLGEFNGGILPRTGITENFESTNQALSISLIYYFDILQGIRTTKKRSY
ncbi:MAG TPA: hypothetical protein DDY13_10975 [Cytophagales bacterium]|nr:hypothetical protein [Cytophagales bacterium]